MPLVEEGSDDDLQKIAGIVGDQADTVRQNILGM